MSALGERSVRIREVEGSNPFRSTKTKVAFGRLFVLPWGKGFEVYPPLWGESLRLPRKKLQNPRSHSFFEREEEATKNFSHAPAGFFSFPTESAAFRVEYGVQ